MAYRCGQAIFGGAREPIRCKVSGTICAHQRMCMMQGRIVLSDGAMNCPARDGKLSEPEDVPETKPAEKPDQKPAKKKPAVRRKSA